MQALNHFKHGGIVWLPRPAPGPVGRVKPEPAAVHFFALRRGAGTTRAALAALMPDRAQDKSSPACSSRDQSAPNTKRLNPSQACLRSGAIACARADLNRRAACWSKQADLTTELPAPRFLFRRGGSAQDQAAPFLDVAPAKPKISETTKIGGTSLCP